MSLMFLSIDSCVQEYCYEWNCYEELVMQMCMMSWIQFMTNVVIEICFQIGSSMPKWSRALILHYWLLKFPSQLLHVLQWTNKSLSRFFFGGILPFCNAINVMPSISHSYFIHLIQCWFADLVNLVICSIRGFISSHSSPSLDLAPKVVIGYLGMFKREIKVVNILILPHGFTRIQKLKKIKSFLMK